MWRALTRNKRFLLTGVLIHQGAEKVKTMSQKSVPDRTEESANVERSEIPGSRTNVVKEESSSDAGMSGWDRVKMVFSVKEEDDLNPQLHFILYLAGCGTMGGFMYGGLRDYAKAVNLFIYSNDTSVFLNAKEAKATLARDSLKALLKGGLLTAPKFGILFGIFGLANTVISSYYGKNGVLAISLAGAFTTAVMKWNLGIRGMISGFITGGLSGLISGTIISIGLSATGTSISDIQNLIKEAHTMRRNKIDQSKRESASSDFEKYYSKRTEDLPVGFSDT